MIFFLPALMAAVVGANRSATAGWIALAGFLPTTLLSVAVRLRLIGGEYRARADAFAVPAVMFAATIWLAPEEMGWPTIVAIAAAVTAAFFLLRATRRPSEGLRHR